MGDDDDGDNDNNIVCGRSSSWVRRLEMAALGLLKELNGPLQEDK